MSKLIISSISKTYQDRHKALSNVSLEVGNGMFGLLGPNGAGKSSLMRTIAGIQKPDEGTIEFDGEDIVNDPLSIKKHLGYLPQDFGVYPKISAFHLMDHIAVLKGVVNKTVRMEQINSLLAQVNLFGSRNKWVSTFSGGMRQRFGIAQALLGDPKIIIVDEPTAGLDPEERNRFNNLLSEIGEQVVVILSTHLVDDVKNLCTKMAIMLGGRIISYGSPSDFVDELDGKIWKGTVSKDKLGWFRENYSFISSRLNAGRFDIHLHSDSPPEPGFKPIEPSLEDYYFITLLKYPQKTISHAL